MTSTEAGSSATEHMVKEEDVPEHMVIHKRCAPATLSNTAENGRAVAQYILSPRASQEALASHDVVSAYEAEWNPVLPPTPATRGATRGREWIYLTDDCWFFCDAPGRAWKQFAHVQDGVTKLWWWNAHSNQWCWH